MNFVKWILLALAVMLYPFAPQAQAAPMAQIEETIAANSSFLNSYDITIENDLSLPFQITWAADPGISLSFWLIDGSNSNTSGSMLAFLKMPGSIIFDALTKGSYQLIVYALNSTSGSGNISGEYGAVPIPTSIMLLGTGLIGLIGLSRRKSNT